MDVADDDAQQRIFIWTAPRLYPSNDSCTYGATQFRQAGLITLCVLWGAFRISDGYNFCTVESAQKVRFGNGFNWGTNHLSLLETNEPKVCDLDHNLKLYSTGLESRSRDAFYRHRHLCERGLKC